MVKDDLKVFNSGNVVLVDGKLFIISSAFVKTASDGSKYYEMIDCNSAGFSNLITSHATRRSLRTDLSSIEKDEVDDYENGLVENLPDTYFVDVRNPYYINNAKLVGESVMDYVRRNMEKIFEGLWISRKW